jgi:outer membrane autotransporter protein
LGRGAINTNGHALTISSLAGDEAVLHKQGEGVLTILHDSPSFTQGFIAVDGGAVVAASNQSLGSDAVLYLANGAMLHTTAANVAIQGGIILGVDGGVLNTAAGSTLTAWVIGDSESTPDGRAGPLFKVGPGTLDWNDPPAGLSYTGDIYLNEGKTLIHSGSVFEANDASSTVNFEGGILAVNAAAAVTISKTMIFGAPGATIAVDNATNGLTLAGVLEGLGGLTKTGPGPMTISGIGTYAGDTDIQAGTLAVKGGQALNAATLVHVEPGATFDVQEAQTIGALEGGGRVLLTDSLTIGSSNRDSNFYGTFAGPGGVIKMGTARVVMNGNSAAFTGPIMLNGGKWVMGEGESVGARVSGPVTVNAGGQLSGSGTVGALTVTSGGIVAPGNSIGTLAVNGNASLESGSLYIAEIGPNGTSDHIAATGQVSLAGQLQLEALEAYVPGTRYTLVSATGGRSGEFSNLSASLPLLDLQLTYDANHAYLGVARNETPMEELAANENEIKTATVLEEFEVGNPSHDAIVSLETVSEVQAALGQMSGDMHASVKSALVQDSHFLRDAALGRLQGAFTSGGEVSQPVVAYLNAGQIHCASASTKDKVFWTQVFGAWGQTNSDGNAAKLNQMSAGAFFGTDTRVGENGRVGGVMGYSTMTLHVPSHHSSGHSDGFHLGVYGGGQWGAWGLRTGAGYSWYDMRDQRVVDFKNYSDNLKSQYRASTAQLFGEVGYRMNQGRFLLEPYFNAAVVSADIGKLNEAGSYAALHGDSSKMTSAFTTLGVHGSSYFPLKHVEGMVRLTVGWRRAYGKLIPSSAHAFGGSEGVITIAGAPIDRNAAVLEAGVDLATTKRITLGLTYAGEMSRKTQSHSGELNLTWKF